MKISRTDVLFIAIGLLLFALIASRISDMSRSNEFPYTNNLTIMPTPICNQIILQGKTPIFKAEACKK